jgi:hypothetical protein
MNIEKAFAAAATRIVGVDPAPYHERIGAIDAHIAKIDSTIAAGRRRVTEIARTIGNLEINGPDKRAAGEMMLRGETPTPAADLQALRDERDGLKAGFTDLEDQKRIAQRDRLEVTQEFSSRLGAAVQPALAAMDEEFIAAMAVIAELYAGYMALHRATRRNEALRAVETLRPILGTAFSARRQLGKAIDLPDYASAALSRIRPAIELAGGRVTENVQWPDPVAGHSPVHGISRDQPQAA